MLPDYSEFEICKIGLPDLFQLVDLLGAVLSPSQVMPATVVTLKWASAQGWLREDNIVCYGIDRSNGQDFTAPIIVTRSSAPSSSRADDAEAPRESAPASAEGALLQSAPSDPDAAPQAPAPVASLAPNESVAAPQTAPAPAKAEPWSEEELNSLRLMKSKGRTAAEMSEVLTGRSINAIYTRLKVIRHAEATEKQAPTPEAKSPAVVAPVSAPSPVPPVAERRTVPVSSKGFGALPMRPGPAAAGFSEIEAVLNALGYADPWDAAMDLELVERLARGEQLAVIADDLGVELGKAKARFVAMTPDGVTIEGQARLLKVLRARAEGAA